MTENTWTDSLISLSRCPLCNVPQAGYPKPVGGGHSTASWPQSVAWISRLDLRMFVCPDCHAALGPDEVRERLIRQDKEAA